MDYNHKIELFIELGSRLRSTLSSGKMDRTIELACAKNSWFTQTSISEAIEAICNDMLNSKALTEWLSNYDLSNITPQRIGIIMAGNIPLVGFLDLMCVLICGHSCQVKPSSKDRVLMEMVINTIMDIDPCLNIKITDKIADVDALIATGGETANNYFKVTYSNITTLLRSSRTSICVISGNEDRSTLEGLSKDIFQYFGLGCRNVSNIFIPRNFDINLLCNILSTYNIKHKKYLNNYIQRRSILTISNKQFIDGGFFLLREEVGNDAFLCEIKYTRYNILTEVNEWISNNDSKIQCVVASQGSIQHCRRVDFGMSQRPRLDEYPDGVDVINFLSKVDIKHNDMQF